MALVFFRRIYLHNRKQVPTDKPVLLAANHPTAFADPCLLSSFIDPPMYHMTRGDLFRNPFFRKLMESINMFPVFRMRDGYTERNRNDDVFEFCENKLIQNRIVCIFVEGEHHLEKHVRPIQKGIVRIAFGTYQNHPLPDLQIIPVGCNYRYGDQPRDTVMINVGPPIYVRDYWDLYLENPNRAVTQLTAAIKTELKKVCLHIDNPGDAPLLEHLLTLYRSEHPESLLPILVLNNKQFIAEKAVCDQINAQHPDAKSILAAQTATYFSALESARLSDEGLVQPAWGAWHRLLYFALGFLPFLAGLLTSYPVIWLGKSIADAKVKKREFYTSVRMVTSNVFGTVYYLLWILIALIFWAPWPVALALALPLLGWFAMFYRENWARWLASRRALQHPDRERLLQLRRQIPLITGLS